MIEIKKKEDCCGCWACVQVCPKTCISMNEDCEGFLYPQVDTNLCIDCHLCEKVCPVINQSEPKKPLKVYAAKNPNEEIRMQSSSGGIFTMLAEQTINKGGVVFGAKFNDKWEVVHDFTETIEGIAPFRGSKYVQSRICDNYLKAQQFLKAGREVLFTGTPCQIAGLKKFLRKEYTNLLTVDVVCHGVPSPLVWRDYLQYINPYKENINFINMRDKSRGWSKYSYLIKGEDITLYDDYAENSIYLKGFICDLFLRSSCYNCPSKSGKSYSDFTLADCWGFEESCPELFDNRGISAVLVNTSKAVDLISKLSLNFKGIDFITFTKFNKSYYESSQKNQFYNYFWQNYDTYRTETIQRVLKQMHVSLFWRIFNKFKRLINK